MATLVFPLKGPMQAWGISSHFGIRDTLREPSKSGIIGLICAAMGKPRDSDLSEFQNLRYGVRVDQEGKMLVDFHTASRVLNASGSILPNAVISNRYFLADACFLVGLEGDQETLIKIYRALKHPKWFLFLGRKSFPLASPPWFPETLNPIQDQVIEEVLKTFPWQSIPRKYSKKIVADEIVQNAGFFQLVKTPLEITSDPLLNKLRLLVEPLGENKKAYLTRQDQPLKFSERSFLHTKVNTYHIQVPQYYLRHGSIKEEENVPQ
ncbi:MAG: type I-E CRISPR-associated protein Cas5/CasD [Chloroflexi bacterium HGW-Chloroflexi-3]|nr:MAG: type I-E CRISPR-associated protein Cas5/CasD [Chloroflexi bacterium HGW-Chloroflexi-3]